MPVSKPLLALTAADVMSRDVLALPRPMSLRLEARVRRVTIADAAARPVGFSGTDFLAAVAREADGAPQGT